MKLQYIYFSLLILALFLFLLPIVAIADPPSGAVKFIILDPSDSTVGTPVTVTIEAQNTDKEVDTNYQNDVTLITSGSATGAGLVDIVNGIGTIEINDDVVETVTLSLSDTEATGLDVDSSQDVNFNAAGEGIDMSITKLDSPDPIIAGDTLTYIITVTNNSPEDDAEDVVVSDTLPLALTSPSLTPSQGTCTFFPCNLGTIASNHSANITITSPTDPSVTGTITNIASVLSDTDDPVTSNNVSTQETTVSSSPSPPPPSGGGGGKATTVTFSGKAFPNAKIFIVDKDVRFERTVNQNIVADENGSFQVNFAGISQGLHSFGLLIKDKDNRATQTKFFNIDISANELVVKDILVPPTIGFSQRLVSRGQPVIVIGYTSPNNSIILEIDDIIKKEAKAEKDGSYKVVVDTGILEFSTHRVRVKQVDVSQKRESDYSLTNAFVVSRLILPKTDLSGDGVVNIKDWSMFLSNWALKDESQKKIIDFNDDGKINISDFSIFIRTIKK